MAYITFQPSDYFNTKLYTGNGSSLAVTGVGFQPDWLWIKQRDTTRSHQLMDAVRGASYRLQSDTTNAQSSSALTSFDSDGFTVDGTSLNGTNASGGTYVSWNWKAGTTSGITTNGSTVVTPSAYSFNQTSGFSIVKYAGNGNTTTKVAHGVGAAPKMIIIKNLDDTDNWKVYHVGIGNDTSIQLNTTDATAGGSDHFYDTDPDTVNFTLGNNVAVNNSGENYIAYCFAEKKGFSKFGSYTGNGNADGAFIYTGFKPAMVIFKRTSGVDSWTIYDNKRDTFNVANRLLLPSGSDPEISSNSTLYLDFLSNGFKMRGTNTTFNASGETYIYMCFAEEPIVSSNDIPATAR